MGVQLSSTFGFRGAASWILTPLHPHLARFLGNHHQIMCTLLYVLFLDEGFEAAP